MKRPVKAFLALAVRLVLLFAAVEFVSWFLFFILYGGRLSLKNVFAERRAATGLSWTADREPATGKPDLGPHILHPYLGYVFQPEEEILKSGIPYFGFKSLAYPLQKKSTETVLVGVTGGSAAWLFSHSEPGLRAMKEELGKVPEIGKRKIEILGIAVGGFRAPQQLMSLSYLLALGGEFDLLINVDGFNEVGLSPIENIPLGIHPAYPKLWSAFVEGLTDPAVQNTIGKLSLHSSARRKLARFISALPLRYSITAAFIWKRLDGVITARINLYHSEILNRAPGNDNYTAKGPFRAYANRDQMFDHLVQLWKDDSLQIHRLSRENGISYYHFLQPNQYVPGSKRLNETERRTAFDENSAVKPGVEQGYPLLIRAGSILKENGVLFYDLTGIFSDSDETMYEDSCCHYSPRGEETIGREIGRLIAEDLAKNT